MIVVSSSNESMGGLAASLMALKLPTVFWTKQTKSTYDMLAEAKPSVLFCCSEDIDGGFCQAVRKYRGRVNKDLKVVVVGGFIKGLEADLVCVPDGVSQVMIKNLACKNIPFPKSANIAQISGGEYNEKYGADLLLVSDEDIDVKTLDFFHSLKGVKIKIVGKNVVESPLYLGKYESYKALSSLFLSSKCYFGHKYLLESYYNQCCGFNYIDMTDNSEILATIQENKLRHKHIKEERKLVIQSLTYFHRLTEIFTELNMPFELELCQTKLGELK